MDSKTRIGTPASFPNNPDSYYLQQQHLDRKESFCSSVSFCLTRFIGMLNFHPIGANHSLFFKFPIGESRVLFFFCSLPHQPSPIIQQLWLDSRRYAFGTERKQRTHHRRS
jgi:hypothetical protein